MSIPKAIHECVEAGVTQIRTGISTALASHISQNETTSSDLKYVQFWLDQLEKMVEDAAAGAGGSDGEGFDSVPTAIRKYISSLDEGTEFKTEDAVAYCVANSRLSPAQLRRHPSTGRRALDQNVNVSLGLEKKAGTLGRVQRGLYKVTATD